MFIKYLSKLALSYFLLVPASWATDFTKCTDLGNQIYKDFKAYPEVAKQPLNWLKLAWLEENLGKPKISKTEQDQTHYEWLCEKTAFAATINSKTNQMEEFQGIIELTTTAWMFTIDFKNLTAVSMELPLSSPNDNGKSSNNESPKVEAKILSQEDPSMAPQSTNSMKAPTPTSTSKPVSFTISTRASDAAIPNYNTKFGTSVKNTQELEIDISKRLKVYADKLLSCTPGNYEYPYALGEVIYVTSTIKGKQEDNCLMESSYSAGNGTVSSICRIPTADLPEAAKEILALAKTEITVTKESAKDAANSPKVFEKNCSGNMTFNKK
jgi:hypothetical protein